MNKRKQIITDVLLNGDFSNVQKSMNTLGFTKLQQYVDYLDGCYSHVTNLEHFREQLLADCEDAQEKYFRAEIYRVNAVFYFITSPAFQDKAVREKLRADMKQACEKYKATKED